MRFVWAYVKSLFPVVYFAVGYGTLIYFIRSFTNFETAVLVGIVMLMVQQSVESINKEKPP